MSALLFVALLAPGQDKKVDWKYDYAAALKDAKQQNRYLVVHFTGPD